MSQLLTELYGSLYLFLFDEKGHHTMNSHSLARRSSSNLLIKLDDPFKKSKVCYCAAQPCLYIPNMTSGQKGIQLQCLIWMYLFSGLCFISVSSHHSWQPERQLPFSDVRLPPPAEYLKEIGEGEEVEVRPAALHLLQLIHLSETYVSKPIMLIIS